MNQLPGIVGFEKLKISCIIGVEPWERTSVQEIFVDVKVQTDFFQAAKTDDLSYAINYVELANICERVAQNGYFLLETYAANALEEILEKFPVEWASFSVRKPGALSNAVCSFVEIKKYKR
jgi:7,8-dihydroneopterin aldolase/epimerase/oxygenase